MNDGHAHTSIHPPAHTWLLPLTIICMFEPIFSIFNWKKHKLTHLFAQVSFNANEMRKNKERSLFNCLHNVRWAGVGFCLALLYFALKVIWSMTCDIYPACIHAFACCIAGVVFFIHSFVSPLFVVAEIKHIHDLRRIHNVKSAFLNGSQNQCRGKMKKRTAKNPKVNWRMNN